MLLVSASSSSVSFLLLLNPAMACSRLLMSFSLSASRAPRAASISFSAFFWVSLTALSFSSWNLASCSEASLALISSSWTFCLFRASASRSSNVSLIFAAASSAAIKWFLSSLFPDTFKWSICCFSSTFSLWSLLQLAVTLSSSACTLLVAIVSLATAASTASTFFFSAFLLKTPMASSTAFILSSLASFSPFAMASSFSLAACSLASLSWFADSLRACFRLSFALILTFSSAKLAAFFKSAISF
mmetsp:Transcript_23934/g.49901  ORF Transcript_23934/g.49901 Transcript_23934/m.49901 type:complete len:245 (-) Transcript_23934:731-1465(-)